MGHRRILFLAARLYFGAFILLTSFYCVLAYIPFTYHWFIQNPLVFWFPVFVRFHAYFFITAIVAAGTTLLSDLHNEKSKRLVIAFFIFNLAAALVFLVDPFLSHLPNDFRSFIWSLVTLFPLAWIALLDLTPAARETKQVDSSPFSPVPALLSALFVTVLYSSVAVMRNARPELFAILLSLLSHLLIFLCAFVALETVYLVVRRFAPLQAKSVAFNLIGFAALAVLLRKLVLSTLGFNHWWADLYAIALSGVFVAFVQGLRIRLGSTSADQELPKKKSIARLAAVSLALLIAIPIAMPYLIGTMDWNFLLQKLSAVAVWAGSFAFFYKVSTGEGRRPGRVLAAFALLTFCGYEVVTHLPTSSVSEAALESYAGHDVSFKVARDVLAPALDDESYQNFYDFLQQNTSLPESAKVPPIDIRLVDQLKPNTSEKPNIFIFVVDSLRQDYLSPYNHAVTFTPGIESFARESVVMEKAFSRYGGTVLSEPAIWTGSMQLHKQYIQPFYPMNSLQKLVDTDNYESLITIDPVVEIMLQKSASVTELDKNPSYWTDYDLCHTLKEIESKIDDRKQSGKPLFVYTQPQNLHTVTLFRLGNKRSPTKEYSGFHRLYASEVERMDQGFGEFIQYLKSRGLYDNSIVVLTSDHGDSLGEFGRWGHGSTMFPEIVRVPLIVHLPSRFQKSMYWNTKQVAFSMDVTPSLYYLLGHRPIHNDEMLGRPLFTESKEEHDQYVRGSYLLASSYGPVYAHLGDNGGSLFIVDAALHKNYLYNLAEDPLGTHNLVSVKNLAENERFIREHVTSIGRFYKFQQGEVLAGTH